VVVADMRATWGAADRRVRAEFMRAGGGIVVVSSCCSWSFTLFGRDQVVGKRGYLRFELLFAVLK
jgi:hypothetical protein